MGRYFVDVPERSIVELSGARIDGFGIATMDEREAGFRARVATREAEIAGFDVERYGIMKRAGDLRINGMVGRLLAYGANRNVWQGGEKPVDNEWVKIEAHAHVAGHSFILSQDIAYESEAADAEALLKRLRLRGENEVPTTPGYCIEGAFFAEPLSKHVTEQVVMHVALPTHPDFAVGLDSMSGIDPNPGLLERTAKVDASTDQATMLRITKMRSGKRSINGIVGDEVLTRVHELNFTTGYGLAWETGGVANDHLRPFLSLAIMTGVNERSGGKPVETSLHEDALPTLWDGISASIRLRRQEPVSASKTSTTQRASDVKLGPVAAEGNVPRSTDPMPLQQPAKSPSASSTSSI